MATITEQIAQARAAGYSDADIARHLGAKPEYAAKIKTALDAGYDPAQIVGHLETLAPAKQAPKESGTVDAIKQGAANLGGGLVRGAGSIGATLLAPVDMAKDALAGKGLSLESNRARRADMDAGLRELIGADPESGLYKAAKIGGEIAGTAGAGGLLARGLGAAAPGLAATPTGAKLLEAIASSGFQTGAPAATTAAGRLADIGIRAAGGAVAGGAQAGLVNPQDAATGAAIGAALPPALAAAGVVGRGVGRVLRGPEATPELRQAVTAARDAGYVVPPTQAKPSLGNRALEGFAGKITTAQNASARNQPITNELAKKAIGAKELSESGLAEVRQAANAAYDRLGQVGAFQADPAFVAALDQAGASSAALRKNFPELVNSQVDELITGLQSRGQFEAQPTIEAIKRFRADAAANRASADPAKVALGRAQAKISSALEDLIERNLQQNGAADLLDGYRAARSTLAKTYDVEKALNSASGNVDANKLARLLDKGRPLSGELRQIAEFAARFPKAAQPIERMGSLPQVSPLDFGALGAMSAATSNPLLMAGVLARPAARSLVLSGPVQNRLAQDGVPNALLQALRHQSAQQLPYRAAPVLSAQ